MTIKKYPDGTSYAEVGIVNDFVFRVNSYEDLWHLNQVVDAANNQGITPCITIPNLIDAQADRRFAYNQSSSLKLVCQFLNTMQATFKIFHPHNPEVVEALLPNSKIIDNSTFIKEVLTRLSVELHEKEKADATNGRKEKAERYHLNNRLTLVSSDAGGFKPLMKLCDKLRWQGETFSASKARHWAETAGTSLVQRIDREDFQGKDILIIDDICVYGGTFKGLAKLLREKNCGKLYLAVSHITVPDLGDDPVTNYFDKVFTTDSKYGEYERHPENLIVLSSFAKLSAK